MESNASMHSFESESVLIHLDSTLPTASDNSFQATSPQVRPPISRRRSRSDVWRYFTRNDEDPNEPTATCDYCAMLDLCNKLEVLEFCFTNVIGHERGSELVGGLKRMLEQMYKKYSKSSVDSSRGQSSVGRGETQSNTFCNDDDENILDMFFQHKSSMGVEESKTELDKYFTESVERMTPDFNILLWWKMNSARFPILAKIARDVLAIPVSTVASESAFSAGGRVLDSFRSSLAPTTVEALICTQNWLKAPSVNYDSQDVMEDVESYKLETEITLQNILNEID